ncbi:Cytochrome b-c1 complex subunit 6 [Zea mays]|uniref:Cytochrome b-c1 complex subunit 6 n=1 Tax=Zea mays TaxID=4577 RepID=A0A1D6MZQ3_MAIZE|nr:Cytochrome b-c1 complex subunit 6 [Zea mays]
MITERNFEGAAPFRKSNSFNKPMPWLLEFVC